MAEAVADGTVGVRFAFTLGCVELVTLGAFERTLLALPRDLVEAVLLDGYSLVPSLATPSECSLHSHYVQNLLR